MTAFVTGADVVDSDTQPGSLLRFALRADATLCAAVGLLVAMAADPLARLAGLSATTEWIVGAALVGYGVLLYALTSLPDIRKVGVGVLTGNVMFAVGTVAALFVGWFSLTGAGTELLLSFIVATVGLSWLQYRGVRRLA